ncbi:MAG: hypothetical protein DRP74_06485 [Candidatus Omnitrophota bacterium]|nr:MAG: hypothetical protein DRP74_06485 [Candidatus Omnitrophota bacterium]
MKQLLTVIFEFLIIIAVVAGIYYYNLSRPPSARYRYQKPIVSTHMDLADLELKQELIFFLRQEFGLYTTEFEIIDVVFLSTHELSGNDHILVTLKTPDNRLFQVAVSKTFIPWAKWQLDRSGFAVIEPIKPLLGYELKVPEWMQELGVTQEQLNRYMSLHPEAAILGESAFVDKETGKYELPQDWYLTLFSLITSEDKKGLRLVPEKAEEVNKNLIDSYWETDYPADYLGPGYRSYLYKKIKNKD